jgi:hypothetical protein
VKPATPPTTKTSPGYDFNFTPTTKKNPPGPHVWHDLGTNLDWAWPEDKIESYWSRADAYCRNLRANDKSDWRLPTLDEVRAIYDPSQTSDCGGYYQCHIKGGQKLSGPIVWTSTPGDKDSEVMMYMFNGPREFSSWQKNAPGYRLHVVCVR